MNLWHFTVKTGILLDFITSKGQRADDRENWSEAILVVSTDSLDPYCFDCNFPFSIVSFHSPKFLKGLLGIKIFTGQLFPAL